MAWAKMATEIPADKVKNATVKYQLAWNALLKEFEGIWNIVFVFV